jgi:hypothetical protein
MEQAQVEALVALAFIILWACCGAKVFSQDDDFVNAMLLGCIMAGGLVIACLMLAVLILTVIGGVL